MFNLIVAVDSKNGIGYKNTIPWKCPVDMKHFYDTTTGHIIIMGGNTYKSLGKPLKNRIHIVFTRNKSNDDKSNENKLNNDIFYVSDLPECLDLCDKICKQYKDKKLFVIGGEQIYKLFLTHDLISTVYLSKVSDKCQMPVLDLNQSVPDLNQSVPDLNQSSNIMDITEYKIIECDTYFNYEFGTQWKCEIILQDPTVVVKKYTTINYEERAYLNLLKEILLYGHKVQDRTATGTLSLFGKRLEFDLSNNQFPLCTTRKLFFRGIFEELMLILRGQTNSKILEEKQVNVWKGNTSREFLDSRKLNHLPVGDMGHSYGFSMRHFGGEYENCLTDYTKCRCLCNCLCDCGCNGNEPCIGECKNGCKNKPCPKNGFDQLKYLIDTIKSDPSSRRLRISLWEPNKMHLAALPPCLEQYQFNIQGNYISCMMTQRSSDYFLAGGWNIATGALLTYLIGAVCNLTPHRLIWNIGDVHIYNNLVEQSRELIKREPYKYPKLFIKKVRADITDYQFSDLQLFGYDHHLALSGAMSV